MNDTALADDALPDVGPSDCDIVMKGGITSGVVYPLAVCELAKRFRLRNVGGTSAGAIAAAAAAAAEYGRGVPGAGFERLAQLPEWLGTGGHLLSLFQPQRATASLFAVGLAAVGHAPMWQRVVRVVASALTRFAAWAVVGALPGAWLAWTLARALPAGRVTTWLAVIVAALVAALGALALTACGVVRRVALALPANAYGLCRGFDAAEDPARPGLTRWLDGELDALAGRTGATTPLTFGDLARGRAGDAPEDEPRVSLQMVATNLTHGRPYRLPFDTNTFLFDPDELKSYFPERVVAWMEAKSPERDVTSAEGRPLCRLPAAADLPVVVAARLSLSFPILISAVPLYAVDFGRPSDKRRGPERCWFSDGGISSNFPVHFFDALAPRWPTFGINLRPFTADRPADPSDETKNIYMPRTNGGGLTEWWDRFDRDPLRDTPYSGLRCLGGFVGAIFETARNWHDNANARLPGYRDRVVHVKLDETHEGGLNLNMSADIIRRLTARGEAAGKLLVRRYTTGEPGVDVSWPNHRLVRYRSAMAMLQPALQTLCDVVNDPTPGPANYHTLITRSPNDPPRSYRWTPAQERADPLASTQQLCGVPREWDRRGMDFTDGAPRPAPDLRAAPRL
jgi:predicted acylesterase/phospholipase RssA